MPEIIVYAVEGRTAEQKKSLMKDITDAVVKNFHVAPEAVTVQIVEFEKGLEGERRRALYRTVSWRTDARCHHRALRS